MKGRLAVVVGLPAHAGATWMGPRITEDAFLAYTWLE
jgi:hypothetical protein